MSVNLLLAIQLEYPTLLPGTLSLCTTFLRSSATVHLLFQLQMHLFSERMVSSCQEALILVLVAGTP